MEKLPVRTQPRLSAVVVLAMAVGFLASLSLATAAHAGFALRFHGNNLPGGDRVRIPLGPSTPADVGATDFTLEFWVKGVLGENTAPAVTCGANANWRLGNILFDRDRVSPGGAFGVSVAAGRIVFGVSTASGDLSLCSAAEVLDGEWHHVAVERRVADGLIAIFIDGRLDVQETDGLPGDVSFRSVPVPDDCGDPCATDPFLVIGGDKYGLGPSFSGGLDEIRISTILRYFGRFEPRSTPFNADAATAALYHFDEGAGLAIVDFARIATGTSPGEIQFGGTPPGPEWSTDSPFASEPPTLLTIAIEGNGSVTTVPATLECQVSCFSSFPRGTEVALVPVPAPSYAFMGWGGDPDCEDGRVVLNDSTTCIARFVIAADLALTMVSAPQDASPGDVVRVSFRVRNRGLASADVTMTRIYLATDRSLLGFQVGEVAIPGLAPDETFDAFADVTIPSRTPTGRYFLIVSANADNTIPEARTDNNVRRVAIRIGPDLVVTEFEAPLNIARGTTVLVRDTTRNEGSVAVEASTTRFFLASRPDATSGQVLGERRVEALDAGQESTGLTEITIPANAAPGLRFIIAVADGPKDLDETSEGNNTSQAFAVIIH